MVLNQCINLKKQINELNKNNNQLNKSNDDAKNDEIYVLLSDINLLEYYNIFNENGFDDLDSLSDITSQDLLEMNIKKLAHRKKILKKIKQR